jgi:hypothetical protein
MDWIVLTLSVARDGFRRRCCPGGRLALRTSNRGSEAEPCRIASCGGARSGAQSIVHRSRGAPCTGGTPPLLIWAASPLGTLCKVPLGWLAPRAALTALTCSLQYGLDTAEFSNDPARARAAASGATPEAASGEVPAASSKCSIL